MLSAAYTTKYPINPSETHAAVLVPLCNSGLPLGEKLGAHSGKVRWAPSRFAFVDFHPGWSLEVSQAEKSIPVARRAAGSKRGGGDNSTLDVGEIEILGRLCPLTRSLSGLRDWPYMTSFKCCVRPFRNDLGGGVPA